MCLTDFKEYLKKKEEVNRTSFLNYQIRENFENFFLKHEATKSLIITNKSLKKEIQTINDEKKKITKKLDNLRKEVSKVRENKINKEFINDNNNEIKKLKKKLETQTKELENFKSNKNFENLKNAEIILQKKDERIEEMEKEISELEIKLAEAQEQILKNISSNGGKVKKKQINVLINLPNQLSESEVSKNPNDKDQEVFEQDFIKINQKGKKNKNQKNLQLNSPSLIDKKKKEEEKKKLKECCFCKQFIDKTDRKELCQICQQFFHQSCVLPWIRNNGVCPECRISMSEKNQ